MKETKDTQVRLVDLMNELINPLSGKPLGKSSLLAQINSMGIKVGYEGAGNTRRALISKADADLLRAYYTVRFKKEKV